MVGVARPGSHVHLSHDSSRGLVARAASVDPKGANFRTVGRDPGYGGIDYIVLAGSGMPTSVVHRSVSRDTGTPEQVVLHRVLS